MDTSFFTSGGPTAVCGSVPVCSLTAVKLGIHTEQVWMFQSDICAHAATDQQVICLKISRWMGMQHSLWKGLNAMVPNLQLLSSRLICLWHFYNPEVVFYVRTGNNLMGWMKCFAYLL